MCASTEMRTSARQSVDLKILNALIFLVRLGAGVAAISQIRIWVASALDLKFQAARLRPRRP